VSEERKRQLYDALVRSAQQDRAAQIDLGAAMKVPLAKGRMRKRLAAAEKAGNVALASELRHLLEGLDRAFPD
jgi:hypothetical protein